MDFSKLFTNKKTSASLKRKRDSGEYPLCVQNIVCTAYAGRGGLNMIQIAESIHGRLAIKLFPACVSRCRETGTVNIIFSTGQIVIAGAKTIEKALLSAHLFTNRIASDLRVDIGVYNFQIVNVVGSFGLGYQLNMDLFYHKHGGNSLWDPDTFKGMRWSPEIKGLKQLTFVIFDTGMIVLTGGKTKEDLETAYDKVYKYFKKYKLDHEQFQLDEKYKRTRVTEWGSTTESQKKKKSKSKTT